MNVSGKRKYIMLLAIFLNGVCCILINNDVIKPELADDLCRDEQQQISDIVS